MAAAIFSLGLFALFVFLRDRRQREFLLFFLLTAGVAAYVVSWLSLWSRFGVSLSFIFRANVALSFALSLLFALFFHYFFVLTLPHWIRVVLATPVRRARSLRARSRGSTISTSSCRSATRR